MAVTQQDEIDFAIMYATHDAFRRDLDRLAAATAAGTTGTGEVRAGWANFKRQLHVHHTVEDAELWPRLHHAVRDRPRDLDLVDEMEAEHAGLDSLLNAVDDGIAEQAGDLAEHVGELSTALGDHMKHEEESALPLIQEVLTQKDWAAFRGAMARRQGPKGAAVYVPWIMDGIGAADRRRFLDAMPSPVAVINRLLWESRYRRLALWGR